APSGPAGRAGNRPAPQPLHYAADTNHWKPDAQAATIDYLTSVGADPNAADRGGATPLHRAVRTRSLPAVRALLISGANPRQPNASGSTPLHLAVPPPGPSGAGPARGGGLRRGERAAGRHNQAPARARRARGGSRRSRPDRAPVGNQRMDSRAPRRIGGKRLAPLRVIRSPATCPAASRENSSQPSTRARSSVSVPARVPIIASSASGRWSS